MVSKYGKSYGKLINIKKNFYSENDRLLNNNDSIAKKYIKQPIREKCKLCESPLQNSKENSFISHNIEYELCELCGHLNGKNMDTKEFADSVYCDGDYNLNYSESLKKDYNDRMTEIYLPKAQFLKDIVGLNNRLLDIGAGSGYFVSATKYLGYDSIGIEISEKQVEFANLMMSCGGGG